MGMTVSKVEKDQYKDLYNKGDYSILQSWEWGEVKKPTWEPLRLQIAEIPVTILLRKIPGTSRQIGYAPRMFNNENFSSEILKALLDYLKINTSLSHLDIDAEITNQEFIRNFAELGFKSSGSQIQPQDSRSLDLTKSEDQLLSELVGSTAQKIRKLERRGATSKVFSEGDEGFEIFWKIMRYISTNTEYLTHPRDYYKKMWDIMSPVGYAKIVTTYYEEKPFGAYLVLKNSHTLYELFGGINNIGREISGGGAGYYLKWQSILSAKRHGLTNYDMWGEAPIVGDDYDIKHQLYNIAKFKEKFGGKHVRFIPQQTVIFHKPSYAIFRVGVMANKVLMKLKKI